MSRAEGSAWKTHRESVRDRHGDYAAESVCDGTYRVEQDDGKRPFIVRCDGCGHLLGVNQGRAVMGTVPAPGSSEDLGF